jgi:hypothetical protein
MQTQGSVKPLPRNYISVPLYMNALYQFTQTIEKRHCGSIFSFTLEKRIVHLWLATLCNDLATFFTQYGINAELKNGEIGLILGKVSAEC